MKPTISIVIPTYKAPVDLLERCLRSIYNQTFRDFEVILMEDAEGQGMAWNSNRVIDAAHGELIKILYQDDYLNDKDALKQIVENFDGMWLVTGCNHDPGGAIHLPTYNEEVNTIGSPSVLTISREVKERFNDLKWVLDLDLYRRLYKQYGPPKIINDTLVTIGLGHHQETHRLSEEIKLKEEQQMYDTRA